MIQGIDINQRIEFVSKRDTTEPKTVFIFKPLSGFEMLKVQETIDENQKIKKFISETVVSISGVEDKNQFIESLPITILGELLEKANEINSFSETEIKN